MAPILKRQPILLLLVPYLSGLVLGPPAAALWTVGAALRFSLCHDYRPIPAARLLAAQLMCFAGVMAQPCQELPSGEARLVVFDGIVTDGPWRDRLYPGTFRMTVARRGEDGSAVNEPGVAAVITGVPDRTIRPGTQVVFPCEAVCGKQGLVLRTRAAMIEARHDSRAAPLSGHIYTVRREMKSALERSLSPAPASFCASILLGIPRSVGREVRDLFRQTGTMHLLSISGLHVGIILIMVSGLLNLINLGWAAHSVVQILSLVLLCALTGGRVPVMRAALTVGCFLVANYLGRATRSSAFLLDAAFIILLVDPGACRSISFQLSFAGYASILLVLQRVQLGNIPAPGLLRRAIQAAAISLAAWCGTAPLAAYYFGTVVIAAPLINCAAVPLFGLLLWAGLVHLIIALPCPLLATYTAHVVDLLFGLLLGLLEWCTTILPAPLACRAPSWWMLGVFYACLAAALLAPEAGTNTPKSKD